MKVSTGFLAILAFLFATDVHSAVVLDRIFPSSGTVGTHVTLSGEGFASDSQIQVNGLAASVVQAETNQIEFIIPGGASSGFVAVEVDGTWFTNPVPFTLTREIPGQLNPPAGVNRAGYRIVRDGGFISVNSSNGTFSAAVPVDSVDVLWAYKTENESAFIAMIPPGTNQAILDAASTAEAFILLNPAVNGRVLSRYTNLVSQLRALPEFAELTGLIASISGAGRDYLDDARVEETSLRTIQALLQSGSGFARRKGGPKIFEPGQPNGTKLKYLNPPAGYFGYADLHGLKTEINAPDATHPDDFRIAFSSAGDVDLTNPFGKTLPTDWFVKVFQLDPAAYVNGFNSVDALTHTNVPAKLSFAPVDTANVPAVLRSKFLDILDVVAGVLVSFIYSHSVDDKNNFTAPNEVPIPAQRPGIYLSEAYSGNIYWGTELFINAPPSQSKLITDSGGRGTWSASLGGNIAVAAIDTLSTVSSISEFLKPASLGNNKEEASFWMEIAEGVAEDVIKGLLIYENEPISKDAVYDLIKGGLSSLLKNLASKGLETGAENGIKGYGAKVFKTISGTLNIAAKISTAAQAVERSVGLVSKSTLALERSVVIIGEPFSPSMTSFFPQAGRGGEVITIQGANFTTDTNFLRVGFCQFSPTDPTNIIARLNLEILSVTPGNIAARIPTNGGTVFPSLQALVFIESGPNKLFVTSAKLKPPFNQFRFLGFPSITGAFPTPARPGGMLEIRGSGFESFDARGHQILIDGSVQTLGNVADDTRLIVQLPGTISVGSHSLAVRVGGFTTASVAFSVQLPSYTPVSGQGYTISVTKNDFSDNPDDGKISVLEGIRIAAGLRLPRQHDPCEFLPASDPAACPIQEREINHVSGSSGGAGIVDRINFASGMIISGALPTLSEGDYYVFGTGQSVTLDGSGAGNVDGILLDGLRNIYIGGSLIIQNFGGNGVHLRNGASNNFLENLIVRNCGGNGVFLEGAASLNEFRTTTISNVTGHGFYLSGNEVRLNQVSSFLNPPRNLIMACGGNGVRLDNGANFNTITPGTVRNCGAAGIHLSGAGVQNNLIGRISDESAPSYNLVSNNGPGAYLGPGAVRNTFRYLNPVGNLGDGILVEGPGCSNNVIDRTSAGVNLHEGGTSLVIENQGSGIHLTNGAQFNLIGTRLESFGYIGSIAGNRDYGILLEGASTAFNTINAQVIGLLNPFASPARTAANGLAGISVRNGSHDNLIGDQNSIFANSIFASSTAIELANPGTDRNYIFGNQIGLFNNGNTTLIGTDAARNGNGVWIHDGPRGNIVGFPSQRIPVPHQPGDFSPTYYQVHNVIVVCTNAGVLLENASGQVGTDGVLSGANVIQGNLIGELDTGGLAPAGFAGVKLGTGAEANIVGGPLPQHGNRILGWNRAGIWINQNNLSHPQLRNRFENNYVEGGNAAQQTTYLTQTPANGVGFLITDSSGHTVGESLLTRNTFRFYRIGLYLANSSSNIVRGFYITNNFNAGIVVRGGSKNRIGGGSLNDGNLVHAIGLSGELPWSGIALSQTSENLVRGNEIGFLAPGRGSIGLLITNASDNIIGGPANANGNVIISNLTHGVVLSGPATANNKLFNNFIGVDRNQNVRPNGGDGVRIENGAHDNFVGGPANFTAGKLVASVPAGNVISYNTGAGVRVSGSSTVGNRILDNSITANGDKGIRHENGGNHLMPPPIMIAHDATTVSGTVGSLAVTPPGSIVQVFTDPDNLDPEGDAFFGQGIVQSNGTWTANGVLLRPIITMTATHGVDGSTSEFGTGGPAVIGFRVFRTDNTTQETISPGANRASILKLSVNAINAAVRVNTMAFDAQGTLPDPTAVAGAFVYRDADEDGIVTETDFLLSGPIAFGSDDGRITFTNLNSVIEGGVTQKWIVAYQLSAGTPAGSDFVLVLTNAEAVAAKYINPVNLDAVPLGNFAIESANFTVGSAPPGQTFAAWQASVFSPQQLSDPQISGPTADPDGDGVMNLGEYAHNLNPLLADRDAPPTGTGGIPRASVVTAFDPNSGQQKPFVEIIFVRRKAPVDLIYAPQHSDALQNWLDALGGSAVLVLQETQEINPGTVEWVRYRTAEPINDQKYFRVQVTHTP